MDVMHFAVVIKVKLAKTMNARQKLLANGNFTGCVTTRVVMELLFLTRSASQGTDSLGSMT